MASYQLKSINDINLGDKLPGPEPDVYLNVWNKSRHGNYCIIKADRTDTGQTSHLFFYRRERCRVLDETIH